MTAIDIPGYQIVKTLGVGGQATVYLAIQKGFDREVALKVMSPILAVDPSFGERFLREAKIVAKLRHKSIVTVYDVGESGHFYYMAMEYLPGGDLSGRIEKGLSAKDGLAIIAKLAQALHFAHAKGYVHRDVKSENILFDEDNQPLLTDFGIAKASNSSTQMTQTGKLIGTPEYMSPEQCRAKQIDGRSDLYSLGIILFEMLTRKVPFTGEDSVGVCIQHVTRPIPDLPARLKHFQWLLDRLLAKEPESRFQTGIELAEAIQNYLSTGQSPSAPRKISTSKTQISDTGQTDAISDEWDKVDELRSEKRHTRASTSNSRFAVLFSVTALFIILGLVGYQMNWFDLAKNRLAEPQKSVSSATQPVARKSTLKPTAKQDLAKPLQSTNKDQQAKASQPPGETANTQNQEGVTGSSLKDTEVILQGSELQSENSVDSLESGDFAESVAGMLQQAESLAQLTPFSLDNFKQSLKLITTVKTMQPDNAKAQLIYQSVLGNSLVEAVNQAKLNQFVSASHWLGLVEFESPQHPLLEGTRQNVQQLKNVFEIEQQQTAQRQIEIKKLLAAAEQALTSGKLTLPANQNALYYYQQTLALQADNQQALDGLTGLAKQLKDLVAEAVANNEFSKARGYLTHLESISSDQQLISQLAESIKVAESQYNTQEKERQRIASLKLQQEQEEKTREERLAQPLIQMQLNGNLTAARDLEVQGHWVEPDDDNAVQKYRNVLAIDDRHVEAKASIIRIEQNMVKAILQAIEQNDKTEALSWLTRLEKLNSKHKQIAGFLQQIQAIEVAPPESVVSEPVSNSEPEESISQQPVDNNQ